MILDNYRNLSFGGYSWKNEQGSSGRVNEPIGEQTLYRNGTGPRRKPVPLDETSYERKSVIASAPQGSGRYDAGFQFFEWTGSLPLFMSTSTLDMLQNPSMTYDENIGDVARLNALSQFNQRDLDLGTAWKERGKTIQLVHGVAVTGIEALNAIRKRNGRELLNVLGLDHSHARARGVVDASLAYHYGMKPLLQDVAGAVQALSRLPPEQWRVTCQGKYGDERTKSNLVNLGSFFPIRTLSRLRVSNRTIISAVQRPLTREQDIAWSLGLDNPLATAWELTPYSFVVDWMLPIGDWLGALNSIKYYDGWQTVTTDFYKESVEISSGSGTVSGFIKCSTTIGGGKYESKGMRRRVLGTVPLIGLPVKDPRSVDHLAKALSLLASNSANGGLPPIIRY
jgi:hypothetical protein